MSLATSMWSRLQTGGLLAFIFLTSAGGNAARRPASAQENDQALPEAGRIRVEAPSVVVDVIVTDKKGRHANGLTAADFAVFENGERQKIVTFISPVTVPEAPTVRAQTAIATPQAAAPNADHLARDLANVRFITLVMDMADLQPGSIKRATDAAALYLQKDVAAEDYVAIYWIDQSLHLGLAFTQDKPMALDALRKLSQRSSGGRLTTQSRLETEQEIQDLIARRDGIESAGSTGGSPAAAVTLPGRGGAGSGGAGAGQRRMLEREIATLRKFLWSQTTLQARAVFLALRAIAQSYGELPGRKNVVVFSEGFMHSPEAKSEMAAVVDAANRANVAFYVIDAQGMSAQYGAASASPDDPSGTREAFQMANMTPFDMIATGVNKFDWSAHVGLDIEHDDLGEVAIATGGFMVTNQNDLVQALASVDRDLREFYTLVYQPSNKDYNGSFRKIKVELLRPGYRLRHRLGYWAISPGEAVMMTPAAAQLLAAVRNGSVKASISPKMNAALLLAPDGKFAAPVSLSLPGKTVKFERAANRYRAGATLVVAARDRTGRLVAAHQRFLTLQLEKKEWEKFEKQSLDITARLSLSELAPVHLEAILQFSSGAVAVAECDVQLGEGFGAGLRLTSLALSNDIQPATGPADPADPLRGANFQIHLPSRSRFSASDKLTVYFGVLREDSSALQDPTPLLLSYAMKAGSSVVKELPAETVRSGPSRSPGQLLVLKQFDLQGLRSGDYTLQVTAEDPAHHARATQESTFAIE